MHASFFLPTFHINIIFSCRIAAQFSSAAHLPLTWCPPPRRSLLSVLRLLASCSQLGGTSANCIFITPVTFRQFPLCSLYFHTTPCTYIHVYIFVLHTTSVTQHSWTHNLLLLISIPRDRWIHVEIKATHTFPLFPNLSSTFTIFFSLSSQVSDQRNSRGKKEEPLRNWA